MLKDYWGSIMSPKVAAELQRRLNAGESGMIDITTGDFFPMSNDKVNNPKHFKEDVTTNIYSSWYETTSEPLDNGWEIRGLNSYSIEELNHLKWLIEQELGVRDAKQNS